MADAPHNTPSPYGIETPPVPCPGWLLDAAIKGNALKLWLHLERAALEGRAPTRDDLAEFLGMHVSSTYGYIRELEKVGALDVIPVFSPDDGARLSNRFRLYFYPPGHMMRSAHVMTTPIPPGYRPVYPQ